MSDSPSIKPTSSFVNVEPRVRAEVAGTRWLVGRKVGFSEIGERHVWSRFLAAAVDNGHFVFINGRQNPTFEPCCDVERRPILVNMYTW